jgi:N-acetylmuramoyl-L-alanine amidase
MASALVLRAAGLSALLCGPLLSAAPAVPTQRIMGVDYVGLQAAGDALGLRESSSLLGRDFTLSGPAHRVDFEVNSRDILVDGLRVFLGDPTVGREGRLYVSKTDFERRLIPFLRPELAGPPPGHPRLIVIDPGHGGKDPGKQNLRLGIMEKTCTLQVAFRLRKLLEASGYKVIMTRTDDRQLGPDKETDLQRRPEIANLAHADLFISIHFNAIANDTRTTGSEVYSFVPEFQRSSNSWSDRKGDDSLREMSPANRQDAWNALLAHAVHRQLMSDLHTMDRGEKIMHLAVLRPLQCPGILVESAFLSNDAEARRVASPAFQQRIAEAFLAGIDDYARIVDSLRPAPVKPSTP